MVPPVRLPNVRFAAAAHSAGPSRKLVFRIQGNVRNSGTGGTQPGSRRHRSGDTVRQSGIYEVIHDLSHRDVHEVVMISGEDFPDCETCKEKVRFRLVRTAPYIFQDEDFEEEK